MGRKGGRGEKEKGARVSGSSLGFLPRPSRSCCEDHHPVARTPSVPLGDGDLLFAGDSATCTLIDKNLRKYLCFEKNDKSN